MGKSEIEPDSVRAMLNGKPNQEEQTKTLKQKAERLQWEAKAVPDMKRRYVE